MYLSTSTEENEPNKKYDQGKTRLDLFALTALEEVGKVYTMGADKYSANGWRQNGGMSYSRLIAATLRHFFAWCRGIDKDEESGLNHLAHVAWNVLALLEYSLTGNGTDDRFKGGNDE